MTYFHHPAFSGRALFAGIMHNESSYSDIVMGIEKRMCGCTSCGSASPLSQNPYRLCSDTTHYSDEAKSMVSAGHGGYRAGILVGWDEIFEDTIMCIKQDNSAFLVKIGEKFPKGLEEKFRCGLDIIYFLSSHNVPTIVLDNSGNEIITQACSEFGARKIIPVDPLLSWRGFHQDPVLDELASELVAISPAKVKKF